MKTELHPNHVGEVVPFSVATCDHLEKPELREIRGTTFGKMFNDGHLAWLVNGPSLEVVWTSSGERQATWEFGVDFPDTPVLVTCITEVKEDRKWKLIVGMDYGLTNGCLCIFDITTSKVVKAIKLPQKITSVEVVSQVGGLNTENGQLCTELRYMYGIVAVGTQEGHVYLLDLVFDDLACSDELDPSHLSFITKQTHNIPSKRVESVSRNRHLAIHLNDGCQARDRFLFRSLDDDVIMSMLSHDVYVSSLLFMHKNGCLSVGFNFGGFQLWNLNKLQLVFTSDCTVASPPIVTFVFQEPDNDPRNFCYLWVVRGQPSIESKQDEMTEAALFSLSFDQKIYLDGFGYFYRDLLSCFLRFEFILSYNVISPELSCTVSSRLINCVAIEEHPTHSFSHSLGDSGVHLPSKDEGANRGLCLFVWESSFADPNIRPKVVLAIFDLNQWYQAQMPTKLKHGSLQICSYFGFFSMDGISEKALPDFLLDVYVPSKSVCRIKTCSTAEKFYYPSSVAFDVVSLIDTGVIHASYLGLHKQIFLNLTKNGPSALVNPQDIFNLCLYTNLLPLHGELLNPGLSLSGQRECILSLALEYNLLSFLFACIREWSTGKYNSEGCSLRFLQEWAWKRVFHIKTSIDRHCLPLFDYSGLSLDGMIVQMLHHYACQLKHLELIFRSLSDQTRSIPTTDQGARELEHKASVISLLNHYLEAILWFLNCGLLPEASDGDDAVLNLFSYPSSLLTQIYSKRRLETQRLSGTIGPTDILLIDGLVTNAGESLISSWEKDGGNGLFPPNSLHALLSIYLLHNVDMVLKHQIVQYLFLDLAELLSNKQYSNLIDQLVKFPSAFSLSPSIIKLTQGFWLLDHKDYEEAIAVLLHPIISPTDVLPWQHHHIMKAFLYQGEAQKALRYARVRKPTMQTLEEVRFHLTLLLANGLVSEAFQYQRTSRSQLNSEDLLQHFFLGCQQTKNLRALLQLPLSHLEERQLIEYLNTSSDPHVRELLVIYYLQRSRYVDAMRTNGQLVPRVMHEADPAARERSATRNAIVDGFSKLLPHIHYQITQGAQSIFGSGKSIWQQVPRPQPVTTHVIASGSEPISRSSLIETIMGKIAEVWSKPSPDFTPIHSNLLPEVLPIVGTPNEPKIEQQHEQVSRVIFPTVINKDIDMSPYDPSLYHVSPAKKSRYLDVSPMHLSQSFKRSSAKNYNIEVLSLLQTPPVRRKIPAAKLASVMSSPLNPTPPSILKVRSLAQLRSTSKFKTSHETESPSLRSAPSPPITPEAVEFSNDSTESSTVDGKIDSRKLRFRFSPTIPNASSSTSSDHSLSPPLLDLTAETLQPCVSVKSTASLDVEPSPRRPLHPKAAAFLSEDLPLSEGFSPKHNREDVSEESNNSSKSTEVYDHEIQELDDEFIKQELRTDESKHKSRTEPVQNEVDDEKTTASTSTTYIHIDHDDTSSLLHSEGTLKSSESSSDSHPPASALSAYNNVTEMSSPQSVPSLMVESAESEDTTKLLKAVTVSTTDQVTSVKEKTPSPRPRASFFSAERSKERFQQMKSELVKAGGSSNVDVDGAEIELVEAESPLASLVKQTLDSVFSKCDAELSSKIATLGGFSSEKVDTLGLPLKIDVSDAMSGSHERPPTKSSATSPALRVSPRTRSQAKLEVESTETSVHPVQSAIRTRSLVQKSDSLSPKLLDSGSKKLISTSESCSLPKVIEDVGKSHFKSCMQETSQSISKYGEVSVETHESKSLSEEKDSCLLRMVATTDLTFSEPQKLSTLMASSIQKFDGFEMESADSNSTTKDNLQQQELKTIPATEIGVVSTSCSSSSDVNDSGKESKISSEAQPPFVSLMRKTLDAIFTKSDVESSSSGNAEDCDDKHIDDKDEPLHVDTGNTSLHDLSTHSEPFSASRYYLRIQSRSEPTSDSPSVAAELSPKVHSPVRTQQTQNSKNVSVTTTSKHIHRMSPSLKKTHEQSLSSGTRSDRTESPKMIEPKAGTPPKMAAKVTVALQAFDSEPRTAGPSRLHVSTRDIDTSTTTLGMDLSNLSSSAHSSKSVAQSLLHSSAKGIEHDEKRDVAVAALSSPAFRTRSQSRHSESTLTNIFTDTPRPRARRHSEHTSSGEDAPQPHPRRQSGQIKVLEKSFSEVETLHMTLRTRSQSSQLETVKETISEQAETLNTTAVPQSARVDEPYSDNSQDVLLHVHEPRTSSRIRNLSGQRPSSSMAGTDELSKEDNEAHIQTSFTMVTRSNTSQRAASLSPLTRSSTSLTGLHVSPQSKTPSPQRGSSSLSSKSSTPSHSPKSIRKETTDLQSSIRESRPSSRTTSKVTILSKSSSPAGSANTPFKETRHQSPEMTLTLRSGTHIPKFEPASDEVKTNKSALGSEPAVDNEPVVKSTDKKLNKLKMSSAVEFTRKAILSSPESPPSDSYVYCGDSPKVATRRSKPARTKKPPLMFSFSQPTAVELEEADHDLLETPASTPTTFIFSPPLTRSKSKKIRKLSKDDTPSSSSARRSATSKDGSLGFTSTPGSSKRTSHQRVSRASRLSPNDTPINFVSPVLEAASQSGSKTGLQKLSPRYSLRRSVVVRKQKGFLLTRRSAKLK